jgi:hypothetical protein
MADERDSGRDERWAALEADLAGRAATAEAGERAADAAELTRAGLRQITLVDRLRHHVGRPAALTVRGAGVVRGRLRAVGADVVELDAPSPADEVVVPVASLLVVDGLGADASSPRAVSKVDARLGLAHVLRRVARDRTRVRMVLVDGSSLSGTIDVVAADHLELAEHPLEVPRRRNEVRAHLLVPVAAVGAVWTYPSA